MSTQAVKKLKIGLTGGIGSGKSTVAKIFDTIGIPVFDADTVAKQLMNSNEAIRAQLLQQFGKDTYIDGQLNRPYLSNIVFKDKYKLELLNAIVHPVTIAAAHQWFDRQTTCYAVKEAALLFESGTAGDLDFVIGVYSPPNIRIARVVKRDNTTADAVKGRMLNQMDENIKMRLCDRVIINDEEHLLVPQVLDLHKYFFRIANGNVPTNV